MDLRRVAAWAAPWTVGACVACGVSLPLGDDGLCPGCACGVESLHHEVDRLGPGGPWLVAAARYGGPIADVLAAMKFRGEPPNLGALTPEWLRTCVEVADGARVEAWVAVPPQRQRLRSRGWHLPDLLAGTVAAATGQPTRLLLDRTDLEGPRARGAAAAPRFAVRAARGPQPRRVGLVDDVITTGSTVDAAIAVLASAGITVACVAVFADARRREARPDRGGP